MSGDKPGLIPSFADEEEFSGFYRRTSAALHGYITRMSGNVSAADDILQAAYMRLLKAPPMDDARRRAYLYRAATSIVIDQWRRTSSRSSRELKYQECRDLSEAYSVDRESTLDLHRLLGQLNERERALLWLAYADEFSHSEIAQILGIAEKSVRVMLFRVREKAKTLLSSRAEPDVSNEPGRPSPAPKGE